MARFTKKRRRYVTVPFDAVRESAEVPKGYRDRPPPPPPADPGPRDWAVPDPADYQPTPERVAADQRAAVLGAVRALGPGCTAADISAAVWLAVDVVGRRLAELTHRGEL